MGIVEMVLFTNKMSVLLFNKQHQSYTTNTNTL